MQRSYSEALAAASACLFNSVLENKHRYNALFAFADFIPKMSG